MRNSKLHKLCILLLLVASLSSLNAQDKSVSRTTKIETLINEKKINDAKAELDKQIEYFRKENKPDSLVQFIKYKGSFILANTNKKKAEKNAEIFVDQLMVYNDPYVTKESLLELAWIYNDIGNPKKAYTTIEAALEEAKKISDVKKADIADLEYELGYYASGYGDYPTSKKHYTSALEHLKARNFDDPILTQQTYNALGGIMWYTSRMDSAKIYFEKSLASLKKLDTTDIMNAHYRPALVNMNISVIANALGNNNEAIAFSTDAVKEFQKFIALSKDEQRTLQAKKNMLMTLDNMGSFHNSIGEFNKARDLIFYSYNQKKKLFEPKDSNIIISLIILGQAEMSLQNLEEAAKFLDKAIALIKDNPSVQLYWKAAAYASRAKVYNDTGDFEMAKSYFIDAENIYRNTFNGEYSVDFLEDLIITSQFYADNKDYTKALKIAQETEKFTSSSDFKNTLINFKHKVNLAQVYFKSRDFKNALSKSKEALAFDLASSKKNISDSIAISFRKPEAILLKVKSQYNLTEKKDSTLLNRLLEELNEGLQILEQRKTIISSHEDLSLLIAQNNALYDFAKKINLEHYYLSNDKRYIHQALSLHESSIYNRIRSRLNLQKSIGFYNIPQAVLDREAKLKSKLENALQPNNEKINSFFEVNEEWKSFQDSLKINYPEYYKMRYDSGIQPIENITSEIPENRTIVRYLFIDENLFAVVLTNDDAQLISLPLPIENDIISQLDTTIFNEAKTGEILHKRYQELWQPIEDKITTEKVTIVPDGALFNLNFETLVTKPASTFREIVKNSLLQKHDFSYNYSLLLLDNTKEKISYNKNLVAFAPEFTSAMKSDYKLTIKDSIETDKTYLTLLPQPFSAALAKKSSKYYDGKAFLNTNSTETIFKNNAAEHKIIHIGTHAESNNVNPELSRLIFAKNAESEDDNSLYTYEIYNTNLASNLAILTACETGKPSYQPGEGMISLAHAFNYAGSESMLTSLWKIDEQSSTQIIENFYEALEEGLPKDEALKKAKLTYLETAQGRTLAPQYWAGLVLIGDTTPIELETGYSWWLYAIVGISLLLFLLIILRRKK